MKTDIEQKISRSYNVFFKEGTFRFLPFEEIRRNGILLLIFISRSIKYRMNIMGKFA